MILLTICCWGYRVENIRKSPAVLTSSHASDHLTEVALVQPRSDRFRCSLTGVSQHARSSFLCWRWTLGLVATLVSTRSKVSVWWHSHPAQNYESHFWLALLTVILQITPGQTKETRKNVAQEKNTFDISVMWHLFLLLSLVPLSFSSLSPLIPFSWCLFLSTSLSLFISCSWHLSLSHSFSSVLSFWASLSCGIPSFWRLSPAITFSCLFALKPFPSFSSSHLFLFSFSSLLSISFTCLLFFAHLFPLSSQQQHANHLDAAIATQQIEFPKLDLRTNAATG